jgi:fructose-bisphosphate aldolase class II
MPVVSMKETLDRALSERYGVAAFNIINDLTIWTTAPNGR